MNMENLQTNIKKAAKKSLRYLTDNRKQAITALFAVILVFAFMIISYSTHAYSVYYNGSRIAVVRNLQDVTKSFNIVENELGRNYRQDSILVDSSITLEYQKAAAKELTNISDITENIYTAGIKPCVKGTSILVDGTLIATAKSQKDAKEAVEAAKMKQIVIGNNEELISAEVNEKVDFKDEIVEVSQVQDFEGTLTLLTAGMDTGEDYQIKKNDTIWDIAVNRGMSIEALGNANPNVDLESLSVGQTIKISEKEAILSVTYQKKALESEGIPFQTTFVNDSTLYTGEKKVKSPGIEGIKEKTMLYTFLDGKKVSEERTAERVIKEPVNEVVSVGTKPLPVFQPTGKFVMPATGRITALYGDDRGDHMHTGIDIVQWAGSPTGVYAADGGQVIKVVIGGYNGGRGNYLEISHGNGISTMYLHMNTISVKTGQSVDKGQQIGIMGNTGRSYGVHLHFEVHKNGIAVNPNNYFGYIRDNLSVRAKQN
ncbi:MAG: peptidoglycan DD-metalloendopeptidase family protein [Eubacteriaceae bacterium]|nr:peptidoglycan DD-metalloendopeptidase family protein [Eubacteriaceae bacterium]